MHEVSGLWKANKVLFKSWCHEPMFDTLIASLKNYPHLEIMKLLKIFSAAWKLHKRQGTNSNPREGASHFTIQTKQRTLVQ